MTSSRLTSVLALLVTILVFGCTNRGVPNTTDATGTGLDAGSDATSAVDAFVPPGDAERDAASVTTTDAGHDAATVSDTGCRTTPVCMDLPADCHYDNTLDPCRCGMIVCDPPASGCSPACAAGEFCEYPADTCGASGGGTCTMIPDLCSALFDPVCGCDGHTYSNGCHAQGASVSVVYHGACETPTDCRTAGCPGSASCMPCRGSGYICLDPGTTC